MKRRLREEIPQPQLHYFVLNGFASGPPSGWKLGFPARFIPKGKLHPIPQPKLVIDDTKIILYHMFCRADGIGYVAVLQALGDKLDDSVFTLAGDTGTVTFVCKHDCLLYKRVASFTRLIPPVIPKRRNSRLKCAFTVLRAILSWLAISALSQPCKSSSTICCSRGPSRTDGSIATPWVRFLPTQLCSTGMFQLV